jgi:hypothetical protein
MIDAEPWPDLVTAAEAIRAAAAERDPWLAELPVAGIGWATVEADRAAWELSALGRFEPGPRDAALGASARRLRHGNASRLGDRARPALLLLEPDNEGLLAASLARFGEGVRVAYLAPLDRADVDDTPRLGPPRPGPLGPARLVIGRPPWGPHGLVLAGVTRRRRDG